MFWMETLPAPISRPNFASIGRLKALVLDSVNSAESRRAYDKAITNFLLWCSTTPGAGFTRATVQAYKAHLHALGLASSTINVRLSAIRRLAAEAADDNAMDPHLASGIGRVKGVKREGI